MSATKVGRAVLSAPPNVRFASQEEATNKRIIASKCRVSVLECGRFRAALDFQPTTLETPSISFNQANQGHP